MAELVRVDDNFQVTLPPLARSSVSIRVGDYLEVSAVADGILLRPSAVIHTPNSTRTILDFLSESRTAGRSKADIDRQLNVLRNEWSCS